MVPDIAHHITQRGNDRQPVFFSAQDRHLYLELLMRHVPAHGTHILGYCLMTNHVHLVATPDREDSLARTLGHTHAEYAQALNRSRERTGHLWQNRFFSCPLDSSHLENALRYVDLNPVRAGLIAVAWEWPWSSALGHCGPGAGDLVLDCDWETRVGSWDPAGWKALLATGMTDQDCAQVRRATWTGEPLGSGEFIQRLERKAGRRLQVYERGRPRKRSGAGALEGLQECLFGSQAE